MSYGFAAAMIFIFRGRQKMKRKFCVAILVLCSFFLSAAAAQRLSIDYKLNVFAADETNRLNWSADGKTVKDGYDATSGASKANSTYLLDSIRYEDKTLKTLNIPVGLRCLLLFPLTDFSTVQTDALSVTPEKKQLTIRFVHRGNAYQIKTDEKGRINPATSFFMAPNVADNIGGFFVIKSEYLLPNGNAANMWDLDWSKIQLVPDVANSSVDSQYKGNLNSSYKNGVLTIKGTLKQ